MQQNGYIILHVFLTISAVICKLICIVYIKYIYSFQILQVAFIDDYSCKFYYIYYKFHYFHFTTLYLDLQMAAKPNIFIYQNLFAVKLHDLLVIICHKQSHHGSMTLRVTAQRKIFFKAIRSTNKPQAVCQQKLYI